MPYAVIDIIIRIVLSVPLLVIYIKLFDSIVDQRIKIYITPLHKQITELREEIARLQDDHSQPRLQEHIERR